ncbi:AAA family ATPase [Terrimonas rubra]|uniref:AAA family ATPase n=1 Tax=Terrimonas rubra TaxID=1035890 RepID=A0ABW6ACW9_9BACT
MTTIQQEDKKLSANDVIINFISFLNTDRKDLIYKQAEDYAETLAKGGNYYYKIKRLINEKPRHLISLSSLPNDLKKLIQVNSAPGENVYLNTSIKALLDDLLIEWKNQETLKFHNLPIRNKILFHGPTGNGKTTIARHIAKLTNLPFVEVNADIIIDSRIGNTGQNIQSVFNQIKEPCVLFWDEVDTIGRKRGVGNDSAAGMENERMVNSILVNLEKMDSNVIFIGATNRKDVLDTAFLRRFDVQVELLAPLTEEKETFISKLNSYYNLPSDFSYIDTSKLNSYSEIKAEFVELARKYVIKNLQVSNQ